MRDWTVTAGLLWFHRVLPGCTAEKYPGFPQPQDSQSKSAFRSRIVRFDIDSISLSVVVENCRILLQLYIPWVHHYGERMED